jgi:hypothetical protein
MEQRLCGILFCRPYLRCGLVVRVSFSSSCEDTIVNIGVWLVLVLVRVARKRPTTDCRQPNVRVRGQTPVPTLPLGSLLRIRPKGEISAKRLANKILIDKSHGKSLLGTLASSSSLTVSVFNSHQCTQLYFTRQTHYINYL